MTTLTLKQDLDKQREHIRSGKANRLCMQMGIPQRYIGKTLEGIGDRDKAIGAKVAVMNGKSLYLSSKPGRGKTHLAVALMLEWYAGHMQISQDGYSLKYPGIPRFLSAGELYLDATKTRRLLDEYTARNVPLLVVDDVGAERKTDWTREVFYLLVDRQYRANKQLILTSNYTLKHIGDNIDDRIVSRLLEMGGELKFTGKDWRVG